MSKKIALVSTAIVIVVALVGVGVWWLFNTGRLVYVAPGSKVAISTVVCGTDVVDKYNAAAYLLKRDPNSNEPTIDQPALNTLATDIKAKKGYEADATCQNILFWVAYNASDHDSAQTAYTALKDLHSKGKFADSNIRSAAPLYAYETYVTSLSGTDGQGGN
ncbi:MAG: hypothetical protein ACOH18_03840 [Candidatus Saccharimonadaceae bacterium]